ncbi:MAG: methanogen output domain 1-containing protein [Candidatus Helarchaeota archaeon]
MPDQLKFIASMFKMCIKEFDAVMGPESIQTIFRLIGERQGEAIEKRMREKFNVDKWTIDKFTEYLIKDVFMPALGEDGAEITITDDNELIIKFKICPFEKAGIDISKKFYCTYTEGLTENSAKKAFGNAEIIDEKLKSDGAPECIIKIKIKS